MLIRHCDQCNKALERNAGYIQVSFESDYDITIAVGLPLSLQGDYCSVECLGVRLTDLELDRQQQKRFDDDFNEPKTMSDL